MTRTDETWHRLLEWTTGQPPAERLAAQVLLSEGFQNLDPSHPLGGKDGGRDAVTVKDGKRWVMAAYFPRGQQSLRAIRDKLVSDHHGVIRNEAHGIVFVTNQELKLAERISLEKAVSVPVEIYHLERISAILDQPGMYGVRKQFLDIPVPTGLDTDGSSTNLHLMDLERLELEYRRTLEDEFGFLSTRGLPRELRNDQPRLPMEGMFIPPRVEPPIDPMALREAFEYLSYRERRVLELRFGLGGEPRCTYEEIGRTFNVTRERIAQIEHKALTHVKDILLQNDSVAIALGLDIPTAIEVIQGAKSGMRVLTMLRMPRLVILGGPGAGKSTLTRYLAWALARHEGNLPRHLHGGLPFLVLVNEFGDALNRTPCGLLDFVMERAGHFAPIVNLALAEKRLLLILDGLDEVTDPQLAGKVQRAINGFLTDPRHEDVSVLMTSRSVGFHPEGRLADIPKVTLAPLSLDEIKRFLRGWFAQVDGANAPAMIGRLMRRLRDDTRMRELASNPLLLTVLALLQARNERLPNERAQLYAAATETLMHSWPVERRGSALSYDTVPSWLAPLARRAFLSPPNIGVPEEEVIDVLSLSWQDQFGGSRGAARQQTRALLEALRDDAGLLSVTGRSPEGVRLWDFLHRSFAEYLVACDLADSYIAEKDDPLDLAHEEMWREVVLLLFGELGRRRDQFVGPLLNRLAELQSTPWETELRRDLRLALLVLANDVPCDQTIAEVLIDQALLAWASTPINPLREDLADLLGALSETRYTGLLLERAPILLHTREQQLRLALILNAEARTDLLPPLLKQADATADEAAIALLLDGPSRPALAHLRRRLSARRTSAVSAAKATIGNPSFAIAQLAREWNRKDPALAERAARVLARRNGPNALAAMEGLLDLYGEPWLEQVVNRLVRSRSMSERLLTLALTENPHRFGALLVLLRKRDLLAVVIVEELLLDENPHVRARARKLHDYDEVVSPTAQPAGRQSGALSGETEIRNAITDMLSRRLDIRRGLEMLARSQWWDGHVHEATTLLRNRDPMVRRLGASLLAISRDPLASERALALLGDSDATVRCAAIWTVRSSESTWPALLHSMGRLITDDEPIDGPSMDDVHSSRSSIRRPIRCCADAAYRVLEETPGLLNMIPGRSQ